MSRKPGDDDDRDLLDDDDDVSATDQGKAPIARDICTTKRGPEMHAQETTVAKRCKEELDRWTRGLPLHDTERDGNCLYHAMADAMCHYTVCRHDRAKVRATVASHMAKNAKDCEPFFAALGKDGSCAEYVEHNRKLGTWGSDLEIFATAVKYDVCFVLLGPDTPPQVFSGETGSVPSFCASQMNTSTGSGADREEAMRSTWSAPRRYRSGGAKLGGVSMKPPDKCGSTVTTSSAKRRLTTGRLTSSPTNSGRAVASRLRPSGPSTRRGYSIGLGARRRSGWLGNRSATNAPHGTTRTMTGAAATLSCTEWGLHLIDAKKPTPTGDCLHEAIAHGLRRARATRDTTKSVRHMTMEFAWRNRDNCGLMPDDEHTSARYLALQGMDGTPGSDRELALASWAFEVSIVLLVLGVPPMICNEGHGNPIMLEWWNDHFVCIDRELTERLRNKLVPGQLVGRQGATAGSRASRCTSRVTSWASVASPAADCAAAIRTGRAQSSRNGASGKMTTHGALSSKAVSSGARLDASAVKRGTSRGTSRVTSWAPDRRQEGYAEPATDKKH